MIWSAGHGVVQVAAAGPRARGTLEQALPGEWAALVLTLLVIAVVGAAILVAACLGHERVVERRRARLSARGGMARGGSTRMVA